MISAAQVIRLNPDLKVYRVSLHEEVGDTFTIHFDCFAEDHDHAVDQATDAYPACGIVHTAAIDPELYTG